MQRCHSFVRRWGMGFAMGFGVSIALGGASVAAAQEFTGSGLVTARVTLAGCTDAAISGEMLLVERPSSEGVKQVEVALVLNGMPPGRHAVHIHETAACTPCAAAGGHFDPGPNSNPSPDGNHPFHSGDLVNITINSSGRGVMYTTTSRITLSPGPLSVFDANGSAIIVHVDPDTYCPGGPVANCAGGARQACGIVVPH